MAFPVVQSVTETAFNSDATAHLVAMPAVVDAGDLLVCLFANNGSATVTTPTGWTQIASDPNGTSSRMGVYKKVADGSEDGATVDFVTSASEKAAAQVYRITSAQGDVGTSTAATGTNGNPDPGSFTPPGGAEDTLWLAVYGANEIRTVSSYPLNFTNGVDTQSSGGGGGTNATVASARKEQNVASLDPGSFTASGSSAWVAYTLGIRPVSATVHAISATGENAPSGSLNLTTNLGITSAGSNTQTGSLNLVIYKPLAATGTNASDGTAALILIASLAATGSNSTIGTAALVVLGAISGSGSNVPAGSLNLVTLLGVTASGQNIPTGSLALILRALFGATGINTPAGSASLVLTALFTATGSNAPDGSADLQITTGFSVTAAGSNAPDGSFTLILFASITATGSNTPDGSATLIWITQITATGSNSPDGSFAAILLGQLTATGSNTPLGAAVLDGPLGISATGINTILGVAALLIIGGSLYGLIQGSSSVKGQLDTGDELPDTLTSALISGAP